MNLKCHAILKSGEMCSAAAHTFVNGHPSCDRPRHYFGESEFAPMTALSVYPNRLSVVKIAIEFFDGMSMKEIAAKYRKSYEDVQEIIRRACK